MIINGHITNYHKNIKISKDEVQKIAEKVIRQVCNTPEGDHIDDDGYLCEWEEDYHGHSDYSKRINPATPKNIKCIKILNLIRKYKEKD